MESSTKNQRPGWGVRSGWRGLRPSPGSESPPPIHSLAGTCYSESPQYGQLQSMAMRSVRGISGSPVASSSPPPGHRLQGPSYTPAVCREHIPTRTLLEKDTREHTEDPWAQTQTHVDTVTSVHVGPTYTAICTMHSPHGNSQTHTHAPVLGTSPVRCRLAGIPCPIPSVQHGYKVRDSGSPDPISTVRLLCGFPVGQISGALK